MPARVYVCLSMRSLFMGKGIRFSMGRFITDNPGLQKLVENHRWFAAGVIKRVDATPEQIAEEVKEAPPEDIASGAIQVSEATIQQAAPPSATDLTRMKKSGLLEIAKQWGFTGINEDMTRLDMYRSIKRQMSPYWKEAEKAAKAEE